MAQASLEDVMAEVSPALGRMIGDLYTAHLEHDLRELLGAHGVGADAEGSG